MAIPAIFNGTIVEANKPHKKRNATLAVAGGLLFGGKEVYCTFDKIKAQKESYKNIMKGFYYSDSPATYIKREHEKSVKFAQNLGDFKAKYLKSVDIVENKYLKRAKIIVESQKDNCRNAVKAIRKKAFFKIPTNIFGGALIGLGCGILLTGIQNRKTHKSSQVPV